MAASNNKVKGLFKGLRYISQIFDNEKEEEMEIGNPTDVKHVAHIGWDGPSVNSPSWMNEFKPSDGTGYSSAPVEINGDVHQITEADSAIKLGSEDRRGRSSRSGNLELPELPKSSRRQSSVDLTDPATREKAEKHRHRKSSRHKDSSDGSRSIRLDAGDESESPARNLPDVPKKNRRKKSKDVSGGGSGSTRSRLKSQNSDLDLGSPSGSVTKSKERTFDEDAESEKG